MRVYFDPGNPGYFADVPDSDPVAKDIMRQGQAAIEAGSDVEAVQAWVRRSILQHKVLQHPEKYAPGERALIGLPPESSMTRPSLSGQQSLDDKNKTDTNLQSSATKEPTAGDNGPTVFPTFNTDEADYFDIRRYIQMGSPPALALEQAKDDKRRSLALSLRDGTLANSAPRPVNKNTLWVRDLYREQEAGVGEWRKSAREFQIRNPEKSLRDFRVTATGYTNGASEFSVNQNSLATDTEEDIEMLAAKHVQDKRLASGDDTTFPNETMSEAHAELVVLEKLARKGQTAGQSLRMIVTHRAVCGHCRTDLAAAAKNAGLQDWTIFEEASGNTLYWRSGMKEFKELREGEDNE